MLNVDEAPLGSRTPNEADLPGRLRAVLAVVYLAFNEGYTASCRWSSWPVFWTPRTLTACYSAVLGYQTLTQAGMTSSIKWDCPSYCASMPRSGGPTVQRDKAVVAALIGVVGAVVASVVGAAAVCPFTGGPWCQVVAGVGSQGLPVRALWMASMARMWWPRVLTR